VLDIAHFLQQSLHKTRCSSRSLTFGRIQLGMQAGPNKWTRGPSGQSRDHETKRLPQFAHVRSFACRGVTIKRQKIFKCSLQVTVVGVSPHVTRAPTEGFSNQICMFSRPGCVGLIIENRVKFMFFEMISSPATSMCSMI